MAYYDIVVSYVNEIDRTTEASNDDWLRIVQADRILNEAPKTSAGYMAWLVSTGHIAELYAGTVQTSWLSEQYQNEYYGPCGYNSSGTLMFGLKVLKSRSDLDYNLFTSYGSLRFNGTQEEDTVLHIDVELENEITISDHRIIRLIVNNSSRSYVDGVLYYRYPGVWEGGYPRDEDGDPVSRPDSGLYDPDTQTITFERAYLGTFRIRFVEEYDSYTLTIPPRVSGNLVTDIYDLDMIYDCTVWGFYSQKYAKKEIDIPSEARDCLTYYTGADGNTYIYGGNSYGYDVDGDGIMDGGSDDPCACPYCAGTGQLLDCVSSSTVDCTCPYCEGTGIIPGCIEATTDEGASTVDDDDPTFTGQEPTTGICYELHIERDRCTGEILDESLVEVPCSNTTTP